jgi:translocation and assembly module TamB
VERSAALGVDLAPDNARFAGPPPIFHPHRPPARRRPCSSPAAASFQGTLSARGVSRGPVSIAQPGGERKRARRAAAGSRRASPAPAGATSASPRSADFSPRRIRLTGEGSVDRRPCASPSPPSSFAKGDAWRLQSAGLSFAGGSATVSGLFGGPTTELNARMEAMPLSVSTSAGPSSASAATLRGL